MRASSSSNSIASARTSRSERLSKFLINSPVPRQMAIANSIEFAGGINQCGVWVHWRVSILEPHCRRVFSPLLIAAQPITKIELQVSAKILMTIALDGEGDVQ